MPRRVLTLADEVSLLEKIKNQLPNTCHIRLVEIAGIPKSMIARETAK
jgi:hypothetical protein